MKPETSAFLGKSREFLAKAQDYAALAGGYAEALTGVGALGRTSFGAHREGQDSCLGRASSENHGPQ
jgi:hypothetical protein